MKPYSRTVLVMVFLIIGACIIGCQKTNSDSEKTSSHSSSHNVKSKQDSGVKVVTEDFFSDKNNLTEEDLFSKFFGDRAELVVVENPSNQIFGAFIDKIILYYIDGKLCQTKYILMQDITDTLVNKFQKASAMGLDEQNEKIIDDGKWLSFSNNQWHVSDKLTHYQLMWELPDKQITLRIDEEKQVEGIEYIETLPSYEKFYKEREHGTF